MDGYALIQKDRNRHGYGVACYIKNSISYNIKDIFLDDIENIFIDVLLPNTKPYIVGFSNRPPNNTDFLTNFPKDFQKLLPETNYIFIFGDLNI